MRQETVKKSHDQKKMGDKKVILNFFSKNRHFPQKICNIFPQKSAEGEAIAYFYVKKRRDGGTISLFKEKEVDCPFPPSISWAPVLKILFFVIREYRR